MRNKHQLLLLSLLCLVIGFALLIHYEQPRIAAFLVSEKLVPEEEHYTELYFEDPISLPTITVAKKVNEFGFTIHNQEGEDMDYVYRVYFIASNTTSNLTEQNKKQFQLQSVRIGQGKYLTKKIYFLGSDIGISPGLIVVELPKQQQEIRFVVNNQKS